jgi:hypothetical protein
MSAVTLAWGWAAVALGKDTGWDFCNYHWYDAYAFLNGRLGLDLAVAHHATYYNPLIHVPFYLLATAGTSWLALFYLGAVQGLTIVPLYLMSRSALSASLPRWSAPVLALISVLGSTAITMTAKTAYDNSILSVLVLSSLATLIVARESLLVSPQAAFRVAMLAGLLAGSAVGLKLVTTPFAIALAVVMAALPGSATLRITRLAGAAAGGALGVLLFGGFWFLTLARATGNPLFPFFNQVFGSPLIAHASFLDERFIPKSFWLALTLPFRYLADYRVADDGAFRDLRVTLAYVLIPLASLLWISGRQARDPLVAPGATRILFLFAAASYAAWIAAFGVYRYIVALEILAPLILTAAVGLVPVATRTRLIMTGLVLLIAAAFGRYDLGERAPLGDPYVQIKGLSFPHPDQSMVLMTGHEPMAYLIPSFPAAVPVLRIDGWLASPADGSLLTVTMRARVSAHSGDLFLLAERGEDAAARAAIAAYGLGIAESGCKTVTANLGGPYEFCLLRRVAG